MDVIHPVPLITHETGNFSDKILMKRRIHFVYGSILLRKVIELLIAHNLDDKIQSPNAQ
jgi:hypothetical protein